VNLGLTAVSSLAPMLLLIQLLELRPRQSMLLHQPDEQPLVHESEAQLVRQAGRDLVPAASDLP